MIWRLAKSLLKLRELVNHRVPGRDKSADGSIGDAAHASRSSDHNPWIFLNGIGVVSAIDITHDPARGFDSYVFAESLREQHDPRIKYVISNRRIFAGNDGPNPWVWRAYSGSNPHNHHVHISVEDKPTAFDSEAEWVFRTQVDNFIPPHPDGPIKPPKPARPLLKQGSAGEHVRALQKLLGIPVDGLFGPKTAKAVRNFQSKHGLTTDAVVGLYTWKALEP